MRYLLGSEFKNSDLISIALKIFSANYKKIKKTMYIFKVLCYNV